MSAMKDDSVVVASGPDHNDAYLEQNEEKNGEVDPSLAVKYRGTAADKQDMRVLGKKQVLRVRAFARPVTMCSQDHL